MKSAAAHSLEEVREREPLAIARAKTKVEAAAQTPGFESRHKAASALLKKAMAQDKPIQAIVWLHRAVDAWGRNFASAAACRKGCDHCCHIPVMVSRAEALYIGKQIGRKPVDIQTADMDISRTARPGYDNPCTFLVDQVCSVFEHRPSACRSHFNLDDDSLLCELHPGEAIHVPYADKRSVSMVEAAISEGKMADIREWFPKPPRAEPV